MPRADTGKRGSNGVITPEYNVRPAPTGATPAAGLRLRKRPSAGGRDVRSRLEADVE